MMLQEWLWIRARWRGNAALATSVAAKNRERDGGSEKHREAVNAAQSGSEVEGFSS